MNAIDQALSLLDNSLRTLFAPPQAGRASPSAEIFTHLDNDQARIKAARLMRVNHVGEICAQALYQGQALVARDPGVREAMLRAAKEETDHLAWCAQRIDELGGRPSMLNPLWYAGALAIGAAGGLLGDKWNLAFLAETERQVEGHLSSHLERLPAEDAKSRAIVEAMRQDESRHADSANAMGAAALPEPVKGVMRLAAKVMTGTSYYV